MDPNPRDQNTDRRIYVEVKKSLLEGDGNFHLKNKGITIIADSVTVGEDKKTHLIKFRPGDGIVDGGHTYKIIRENRAECPQGQFVKVEILTGITNDLIVEIARGLNTSVQVQQMALANLDDRFTWIKEALDGMPYSSKIAYKQNQDGDFTVRDLISFLTLFNIAEYPDASKHPKAAYSSKEACLTNYLKGQPNFEKLRKLLPDILSLYDYIHQNWKKLYNNKYKGKGGKFKFAHDKKLKPYPLIFLGTSVEQTLTDGALYPMLGAFRFFVEEDPKDGMYKWKVGSFAKIKKIFDEVGAEMVNITSNTSENNGRNPNAIGKDDSHWDNLYKTAALHYLQQQMEKK